MTPGPMGFRGAHHGARWLQGAQQKAHRNDTEKSVCGRPKTFFLGDQIKIRTKLWHFPRLFWSSQNRRSVIFELTPGPHSALCAPARNRK